MSLLEKQLALQMEFLDQESKGYLDMQRELLEESQFSGMFDFDDAAYHQGLGISKSQLDTFARTPQKFHYRHILRQGENKSEAMSIGDLIHKAILEPHLVHENYVSDAEILEAVIADKPDVKSPKATKKYKEMVKEFEDSGKTVLADEHFTMMRAMVEGVYNHPKTKHMLANGHAEKAMYSIDPETGLLLRGKADFIVADGIIIDIKTTVDASPDAFSRSIWNYRYHVQSAFYLHIAKQAFGAHFKNFVWICLEKESPYDVAIYTPDEGTLDFGERMFRKNLNDLARCFNDDKWPGYSTNIESIALPNWAWAKGEELIDG